MGRSIKIKVNGKEYSIMEGTSILSLLNQLNIDPSRVVVEYNKEIIQRSELENIFLKDKDVLEIITFVGGGHGGQTYNSRC